MFQWNKQVYARGSVRFGSTLVVFQIKPFSLISIECKIQLNHFHALNMRKKTLLLFLNVNMKIFIWPFYWSISELWNYIDNFKIYLIWLLPCWSGPVASPQGHLMASWPCTINFAVFKNNLFFVMETQNTLAKKGNGEILHFFHNPKSILFYMEKKCGQKVFIFISKK